MRGKALFLLMVFPFILNSADVPIIFVHGNKSAAKPLRTDPEDPPYEDENYGLETWYPMKNDGSLEYPTAMTKIIGYQGYDWGVKDDGSPAIDCDINTELMPDQGTKRVFNFSFYSPDGSPGVIWGNTSEGEKNLPLWKRVSYNVGYSLGICLRGKDLTPLSGDIIFDIDDFLSLFYLLHSLEASVIYPFGDGKGIEVGVGYGWARISPSKYDNWRFKFLSLIGGYEKDKILIEGEVIYTIAKDPGKVQGSVPQEGKGTGYKIKLMYRFNKYIACGILLGNAKYQAKTYYPDKTWEYNMVLSFYGFGVFIRYRFLLTGGVK